MELADHFQVEFSRKSARRIRICQRTFVSVKAMADILIVSFATITGSGVWARPFPGIYDACKTNQT